MEVGRWKTHGSLEDRSKTDLELNKLDIVHQYQKSPILNRIGLFMVNGLITMVQILSSISYLLSQNPANFIQIASLSSCARNDVSPL